MKNILGLDVGDKRIGLAILRDNIVATYGVINNENLQDAILEIGKVCRANNIEEIVIGIPKNNDPLQADKIHTFARELTKNFNLPINFVDETLTSKEAERIVKTAKIDPRSEKYKQEIDKLSASLILEQYISNHD